MSALTGLRIVELADSVAGEYCRKLLADFGAEVIKVEPPGCGSRTRAMAPVLSEGCEAGGLFAYLNTNKQSVVLDAGRLDRLIGTADAVIEDRATDRSARHPDVVFCSITPFGSGAPAEFDTAQSINVFQASGWGYHTPSHADPGKPPLQGPDRFLADYEAGLDAALCIASSLFGRLHTGRGEAIDVSQQSVLVSRADCILGRLITGEVPAGGDRGDYDQAGPAAFFAPDRLGKRVMRLIEFVGACPGLMPADVRSPAFLDRFRGEVPLVARHEGAVARLLAADTHYVALCHWNANVDNAWFWRDGPDGRGALRCGLMDWGCVGQMNLGMALWGALSGAETRLRKDHFDELLHLFVREFQRCGGPLLNPDRLRRHTVLYAAAMGVAWLLDAPALLLSRFGEALPGSRADPRIRDDESVRAPLQMLTNLLTLWERYRIGDLLNDALGDPGVC